MAIKKINYSGSSKVIKRLCEVVNSIIDAGTGGSTVSYQQTLQSGTETGEITIDGVAKKMYAPAPPTKVSDLQNDTGFITSTVSNLINYYTKTETYTKAEVDAAIAAVSTLNLLVVQTLPTQDISTTTIYLVPKQTAGTQNVYDEYIYIVTGGSGSWELIGDTTVDLSNYYTKTQVDNLLSAKVSDNPTFTEASTRANIASSESFATILGKIKKFFTDLKTVAFSGSYTDLSNIPTNLAVTDANNDFKANQSIDLINGTTSSIGNSRILLGNATAEGTQHNSRGVIRLYGKNQYYTEIFDDVGSTANRDIKIPDKSGTIALNSYVVSKVTYGTGSVTLNITKWDRYGILIFGSSSGSPLMGIITIETPSYNYVRSPITIFNNGSTASITVTKNNDDSITISGLSLWTTYTFLCQYDIS